MSRSFRNGSPSNAIEKRCSPAPARFNNRAILRNELDMLDAEIHADNLEEPLDQNQDEVTDEFPLFI